MEKCDYSWIAGLPSLLENCISHFRTKLLPQFFPAAWLGVRVRTLFIASFPHAFELVMSFARRARTRFFLQETFDELKLTLDEVQNM